MNVLRLLSYAAIAVQCAGCAFIRFERGPYVVRDVEVVYSAQEDTTFLFWKLPNDAILKKVSFEMAREGDYIPIELSRAPFPADPFKCGDFICFQYQVAGEYTIDPELPPIRSVHKREGVFAGTEPRFQIAPVTFRIDPIGIDNNKEIDPHLFDFFKENGFSFRREFEHGLTDFRDAQCEDNDRWEKLGATVPTDRAWLDDADGACLYVRPKHRDDDGVVIVESFLPSAVTVFGEQRYTPPVELAPVVYGLLLDMEIPSDGRCSQVKNFLINTIDASFQSRSEEFLRLGIYTPISSENGAELSGCEQQSTQDYPIERMVEDAKQAELQYAPKGVRVVWVYVNNSDLPPSERVVLQLIQLASDFAVETSLELFTLGIGSNIIIADVVAPWDATIGWRPIEDDTFKADLMAFGRQNLPFHTLLHSDNTDVEIQMPDDADDPLRLKVCQATPLDIEGIGISPGGFVYDRGTASVPWPTANLPFFRIILEPQYLVPKDAYVRRRIDLVVEVCERFCENPFQTRGGERFSDWAQSSKCQWAE